MMKVSENPFVFKLDHIVFEGVGGRVGPLSLEVARGDDRVVYLGDSREGMTLARIIKGTVTPTEGAVIKKSGDATGWIVRDGIIVLVGEEFFSKTVRDEITFAAQVGKAKGTVPMKPFLTGIMARSGLDTCLDKDILGLSDGERRMLVLVSALCMLPDCLVFLDPLQGFDEWRLARYLDLLRYGKETLGFASLQILPEGRGSISFGTPSASEESVVERKRP